MVRLALIYTGPGPESMWTDSVWYHDTWGGQGRGITRPLVQLAAVIYIGYNTHSTLVSLLIKTLPVTHR